MTLIWSCKKKTKQWSIWSAQLMLSNEDGTSLLKAAAIWQTSRTWCQSWRCKGRPVCNMTEHATQSRLIIVCQSLTNAFRTFLCSSHLLHSCDILLEKMLRLIHSYPKSQHCFTWTLLESKMKFWHYELILSWSPELMDSSGTFSTWWTYPNMRKCDSFLTAVFGSTYLCESAFSHMKIIKSKYRSTMTDDHLEMCLRMAVSSYCSDCATLADSIQCKSSEETQVKE